MQTCRTSITYQNEFANSIGLHRSSGEVVYVIETVLLRIFQHSICAEVQCLLEAIFVK